MFPLLSNLIWLPNIASLVSSQGMAPQPAFAPLNSTSDRHTASWATRMPYFWRLELEFEFEWVAELAASSTAIF
jgi:hypothetical protein